MTEEIVAQPQDAEATNGAESPSNPKESPIELGAPEKSAITLLKDVGKTQDPDGILQKLGALPGDGKATSSSEAASEKPEQATEQEKGGLKSNEDAYLGRTREKFKGKLDERYTDPSTEASYITQQVDGYVNGILVKAGGSSLSAEGVAELSHDSVRAELAGKALDQQTAAIVLAKAQERVALLFNSEHASKNPEKQRIVSQQTEQYVSLLVAAQAEGSMQAVSVDVVLQLVDENIAKLAYQDRAATENWLGDHGVRHLAEHNIGVSMKLADEMERNGAPLTAAEKVMLHQVMIDHDLGYATDAVRNPINKGGFGADGGHNVLAAKYIRQMGEDSETALSKVFTGEQIAVIHQGILEHDSRDVKLTMTEPTVAQRNENFNSIIHTADNTHAFADKLPEILYGHPDTLRVMRLMKTAGEIGDAVAIDGLRAQLIGSIDANTSISSDDKQALKIAAGVISPASYEKSVPRICGNKPEFAIDNSVINIGVTESAIHREVIGMFSGNEGEQLVKFIGDTTGIKNVDLGTTNAVASPEGSVVVTLQTGEARATEKTDYEQQIDTLINDPAFRNFVIEDSDLSGQQKLSQKLADEAAEGSQEKQDYMAQVSLIKNQRKELLHVFLPKKEQEEARATA